MAAIVNIFQAGRANHDHSVHRSLPWSEASGGTKRPFAELMPADHDTVTMSGFLAPVRTRSEDHKAGHRLRSMRKSGVLATRGRRP